MNFYYCIFSVTCLEEEKKMPKMVKNDQNRPQRWTFSIISYLKASLTLSLLDSPLITNQIMCHFLACFCINFLVCAVFAWNPRAGVPWLVPPAPGPVPLVDHHPHPPPVCHDELVLLVVVVAFPVSPLPAWLLLC